jgi:heptosyltransferase I
MKIALTRLSSLGDIILCLPSLQLLRRHLPDCHITWVTDRRFADILDYQPDIQQVIKIDLKGIKKQRSLTGLVQEYKNLVSVGHIDAVIDLHGMIKSAITNSLLRGRHYGFDHRTLKEPLSSIFYQQTFTIPMELTATCRYAALVMQCLGLPFLASDLSDIQPFLFWREEDLAITDSFFSRESRNIIIVPETSARNKNYPPEKFARLSNLLGENILFCHGNQQEFLTATTIAQSVPHARVLPRLNLNQLKAAIGRADLVIGGDSGPTHIAWGCGVPSITLFGATPVCICPTRINRVIKTSSSVNMRKADTADMSIRSIDEEDIARIARDLLQ